MILLHHQHVCLNAGKWTVTDAVANAETRVDFKKIMGYHQPKAGFLMHYLFLKSNLKKEAEE